MIWMDSWVLNTPPAYWPQFAGDKKRFPMLFRFFETQRDVVVLSSSNQAEVELNLPECQREGIPVLRRKGGGGTVVLGKGCVVLTFAFFAQDIFGNKGYFSLINELWIEALAQLGVPGLSQQGISDICFQGKKVAGTSIFRKKHLLVYQGSLLVSPDLEKIGHLLAHPSREPDYRQGRNHRDFLTTISQLGCSSSPQQIAAFCQDYFLQHAGKKFEAEALSQNS